MGERDKRPPKRTPRARGRREGLPMIRLILLSSSLVLATLLSGCFAWFDSGVEWRDGLFAVIWVDTYESMSLGYEGGRGCYATVIGPEVFAVGSNSRYIVAKQHPNGNKSITNYFIVDKSQDCHLRRAPNTVLGPLPEAAFLAKSAELKLPEFSRTIEALR